MESLEPWYSKYGVWTSSFCIPQGALEKCGISGPVPDLLNLHLYVDKTPKGFTCTLEALAGTALGA